MRELYGRTKRRGKNVYFCKPQIEDSFQNTFTVPGWFILNFSLERQQIKKRTTN